MKPASTALLVAIALLLLAPERPPAGDPQAWWPSWRGPRGTGVAPRSDPPVEWSETKNVRWKVEVPGLGHSTPVVWGDRLFLLTAIPVAADANAPAPHRFAVLAIERASGRTIWQTVVREEPPHEAGHATASPASASPITDGERVYAFFGSRGLYCLDMQGTVLWQKELGDMRTRNAFGEGASPALHGETLVVNWDHEGDDFIVALDRKTGQERWRAAREEPTTWSTPLVIEDGGRRLVIVSATNLVRAYDLETGKEAWTRAGLGLNCIPTPVASSGLVFVMSGFQEAAGMALRTATGEVAWRIDRGTSYVPSPLLYDGRLYFLERFRAVLSAYDLATGRPHYASQRLEGLGNIYASPVGAAGRVYIVDREGTTMVVRHAEAFERLALNKLDDGFDASPVIAGDELYLRGHERLYCIAR